MSLFTKLFDPFFETNKELQSAFESRFHNFYENDSFRWTSRPFSFLPESESLKIQALYSKLTPFFECTGLLHVNERRIRFVKKDIFEQKQEVSTADISLDLSQAPCFQWIHISSSRRKHSLLSEQYGIKDASKFQLLAFKLRNDYALIIATAQAEPWLRIKLDAFREQIILGYCDNE
ncbi:MAG: hypothetical protein JNL11_00925 [Bdellovibrionaceae bacterium]|nr:hypothetical protein [Pseudobdellovibrionaceae bacterium]